MMGARKQTQSIFIKLFVAAWIALSPLSAGAVESPSTFTLQRAPQHPGSLENDAATWAPGRIATTFQNVTTRQPARLSTTAYVLYDASALYVAFTCDQPGVPITASQSTNNVGFGSDDFVGVGIDTGGNGAQTYYFETTPAAVRYQQASENARYQPIWNSEAHVGQGTWSAVLRVPFSALRIRPGATQTWRINFVRSVGALAEHYSWAWDGRMGDATGGQWPIFSDAQFWPSAHLQLDKLVSSRPRPRFEIFGLLSAGEDRNLFAQANGTFAPEPPRYFGLDVSVPLANTINFVGTFHPDFSNVEVDQTTIVPQEFPRLLGEYRPFFAQGANFIDPNISPSAGIFTPNNQIFYSPSIGPFNNGEKVEGAFGNQAFGVMQFSGNNVTTGSAFNAAVYAFAHALPDQSFHYWFDGVIADDSLEGNDATNEVGAQDLNLHTGLYGGFDQAFENGTFVPDTGHADSLNVYGGVQKPNYNFRVRYQDVSPTYGPAIGYTTAADLRGWVSSLNLSGAFPGVKSVTAFLGTDRFVDASGAVHQSDAGGVINATFANQFSLTVNPIFGTLRSYATEQPGPLGCSDPNLVRSSYTGYPNYLCPLDQRYNQLTLGVGYRDGTPSPIDLGLAFGPFGGYYLHQYTSGLSRPITRRIAIALAYDGTYAVPLQGGTISSQWLRRVIATDELGADSNVSLEYRSINGSINAITTPPGVNFAVSFRQLFKNGNSLYLSFGTPAANQTLNRFIAKYILTSGSGTGT
jgi:hypothetical protein